MTATSSIPTSTGTSIAHAGDRGRGRVGAVVLGSIAAGLAFGLLLVLAVFAGDEEAMITGSALLALGTGFLLLAVASSRLTDLPQPWAFVPAVATSVVGLALLLVSPGNGVLGIAGWVWPALLVLLVVYSIRGARRSLRHWSRRSVLYPALVVLLLVAIGGAFETVTEAAATNPAPSSGRTYLVDGHRLYLNCVGSGAPTVLLFSGLGERTPSWAWVQESVAPATRVCAFDRAGEGWSGDAPGPQDGHALAADLHGLLKVAKIPAPYVLAGHSTGGAYALVYAQQYPREVAGLALIDSATPHQFELPSYPGFYSMFRRVSALFPSLARAGIARLTLGRGFAGLPPSARESARAFASSPRDLRTDRTEFEMLPTVFDQARALTTLHGKPLGVLSGDVGEQDGWAAAQAKLARLSSNSVHRTAHGAAHAALLEDRRYAVLTGRTIVDVVRATREGGPR